MAGKVSPEGFWKATVVLLKLLAVISVLQLFGGVFITGITFGPFEYSALFLLPLSITALMLTRSKKRIAYKFNLSVGLYYFLVNLVSFWGPIFVSWSKSLGGHLANQEGTFLPYFLGNLVTVIIPLLIPTVIIYAMLILFTWKSKPVFEARK